MSGQSGVSNFQRVSQDSIDGQLTAKALIGKNVHDSQGEKLGEVEDVVLDSTAAPQLATAISTRSDQSGSRSAGGAMTSGATRGSTASSATGDRSTAASGSTARNDLTSGATAAMNAAKSMAGMTGGAAAIISTGGMFSRNDLVRVPLSQLQYDSSNDRLTVNATKSQFSSLTEGDESTRNAAE